MITIEELKQHKESVEAMITEMEGCRNIGYVYKVSRELVEAIEKQLASLRVLQNKIESVMYEVVVINARTDN